MATSNPNTSPVIDQVQGLVDEFADFSVEQFRVQLENNKNSTRLDVAAKTVNGLLKPVSELQVPQ